MIMRTSYIGIYDMNILLTINSLFVSRFSQKFPVQPGSHRHLPEEIRFYSIKLILYLSLTPSLSLLPSRHFPLPLQLAIEQFNTLHIGPIHGLSHEHVPKSHDPCPEQSGSRHSTSCTQTIVDTSRGHRYWPLYWLRVKEKEEEKGGRVGGGGEEGRETGGEIRSVGEGDEGITRYNYWYMCGAKSIPMIALWRPIIQHCWGLSRVWNPTTYYSYLCFHSCYFLTVIIQVLQIYFSYNSCSFHKPISSRLHYSSSVG